MLRSSAILALAIAAALSGSVQSFAPPTKVTSSHKVSHKVSHNRQIQPLATTPTPTQLNLQLFKPKEETIIEPTPVASKDNLLGEYAAADFALSDEKKLELILLAVWGVSLSAFILINNAYGPWPLFMKQVPERIFFLFHMYGGMLFAGGIILTTAIEREVAKSNDPQVLKFWFDKVPALDGLIVVPALTVSMISGTGLSIVRYGGLNIAPPHVDAIFWVLIMFLTWWAATDLTTQGAALNSAERAREEYEQGLVDEFVTPKIVVDRHFSNVVSCFFVLMLYAMMVTKPGTLYPWPWNT
ncbi:hypothetical protein ACHAWO_002148 [Cyclotella atomus]|uniref:NnrU domain-containing protein n=1 Tax=Cyclotella atomus TaxID=382360 RepID=A0ABD3QPK5_9STRA